MSKLADALGIKSSYLSQVLKGEKNLSQEQGFFLSKFFELDTKESRYLQELINLDRAASKEYKLAVQKRIEGILRDRDESAIPEKNQTLFYSSWLYSAVQLTTGIPGFQTTDRIASRLGLDLEVVNSALRVLIESGLCRTDDGMHFHPVAKKTSLKDTSPLAGRHKINWRLKALEHVPKHLEEDLFFTGVVRIDRKSYEKISTILKDGIKAVHQSIETADDELLACMNIDFFEF